MATNLSYIIAIGASAGGMEEIHHFFDNTPLDAVSYVIVQHLSPDFKSRMVELLKKHSKLKVQEAEENMQVEENHVYFIPNKNYMTIDSEGKLHLTEKESMKRPHLTVDVFLYSLAEAYGKKAIAVILSGTGTDGTKGVVAVKKAGGMVIAADPAYTEFDAMPASAIATGVVDYVLEPKQMPAVIAGFVKSEGALPAIIYESIDEKQIVKDILELINARLPLDFSDYKPATIFRRIKRRAQYHNLDNLEKYYSLLQEDPHEIQALAQDFFISVTAFFRDPEAFEFIEKNVIPEIIASREAGGEIKLWVSGCATGEEAYSLAILLYEQLKNEDAYTFVRIFATDIDRVALAFAGKGVYNKHVIKNISPERIDTYFTKEGDDYKIDPKIRNMIIFAQHDMVKNPPYCNMDFISCRNLLIYMSPVLQKKIFHMLHFGLKNDGFLLLGPSENVHMDEGGLQLINPKWKIYKNVNAKKKTRFDVFSIPAVIGIQPMPLTKTNGEVYESKITNLTDGINEALINDLNCLVVCTDEENQVLQTYGDTTKYLLQKNFTLNLEELLSKPLALAFNIAKVKALKTGKKVVINGINAQNDFSPVAIKLQVTPLPAIKGKPKMVMSVFSDDEDSEYPQEKGEIYDTDVFASQYAIDREENLHELKEKLYLTNEKLEASVENMQSFNEELLSSNEEMQSANEEMQSLIEELHTVNKDYQLKNRELNEINDDLNNYFRSNQNGQLYVNSDLVLMKFSPGTVKHINLLDTDIGRPISNISTNIRFETIIGDIRDVLKNREKIIREVQAIDGKWYQLTTLPYIQQPDNTIAGAIISFNDITSLKETQKELDKTNKILKLINADLNNFVYSASHDLLGPLGNIESTIAVIKNSQVTQQQLPEYLEMIDTSVKNFKIHLKELAAVGKIEGEMLALEPVDIGALIEDIRFSISDKIASTNAIITLDLEVLTVYFSKKNLRSVLYNLISNAIKYKSDERNPVILIRTRKEDGNVSLSIKDNGAGMPKDKINKIFNLYSRIKLEVEGQGIGLYLAKKIIDAAGGRVIVDSEPGKGSTFTLYFNALGNSAVEPKNNIPVLYKA